MKIFIFKCITFFTAFVIFLEIFNYKYLSTDPFDTNRFQNVPDGIQVCNIGASYSRFGFNYEDYNDLVTFNFGLISQSSEYDYRVLNYYKDKLADGCIVFIVVSNLVLVGPDEVSEPFFKSKNQRYYTFLPKDLIKEYSDKERLQVKYLPSVLSGGFQDIIFGEKDTYNWIHRSVEGQSLRGISDKIIKSNWTDKSIKDDSGHVIPLEEDVEAIYKIIELCEEVGAIPILITTPFPKEFNDSISVNASEENNIFYKVIEEIVNNTNVDFYDYSYDSRFINDYSLFFDEAHLNKEGARVFTDIVMNEI